MSHCRANRAFYKYVQLLNRGQKVALLRTAIIYNSARNSLHPKFRDVSHTIPILQTTFLRSRRDRQPWLETDKVLKLSSDVLFLFYSMEFVSSRNSSPKLPEQGYFHLHPKITWFVIVLWWYNLIYKKIEKRKDGFWHPITGLTVSKWNLMGQKLIYISRFGIKQHHKPKLMINSYLSNKNLSLLYWFVKSLCKILYRH